jgi:hypothetical protein
MKRKKGIPDEIDICIERGGREKGRDERKESGRES